MKEIKRVRTNRPLYFYDGIDDVLTDNPKKVTGDKSLSLGENYEMLRKGVVMTVHKYSDWDNSASKSDKRIVCLHKKSDLYILFDDMKEFEECGWFEEVQ